MKIPWSVVTFFFFNDTATTEIYTLSLHDALPISITLVEAADVVLDEAERDLLVLDPVLVVAVEAVADGEVEPRVLRGGVDRKSTRLNSSHANISYAVFCLKKKNNSTTHQYVHST